jgi:hypothetical protein
VWHRTDDGFRNHAKVRKAARLEPMSIGFWTLIGTNVSEALTDGVISVDMIDDAAHTLSMRPAMVGRCMDALVESGLWHNADTVKRCDRCKPMVRRIEPGGALFHDWLDYHPTHDETLIPIDRLRWERKQDLLHNQRLCKAVVARDGERCRYCAIEVDFKNRRGATGGTYDHVDPNRLKAGDAGYGNTLENIVVACRRCNGQKRNRTPAEWVAAGGRALLPVPTPYDLTAIEPGYDRDQDGIRS